MSVIEPGAQLADDVIVGPFCHIGPKAVIGPGCRLLSHVSIRGRTIIGKNNTIWPHAVIGGDPQDLKYRGEDSRVVIGDHNDIRESVTIHKGTQSEHAETRLGNHNLLMAYTHIGHDSIIGNHTVIANAVQLAGHVLIEDHAVIGGASAIHHFVTIGPYAFIGGMTRLVHDVPPYLVVEGNPARPRKINSVLLKRHHFSDNQILRLKQAYRQLYGDQDNPSPGSMHHNLDVLEATYPHDQHIRALTQSLRRMAEGVFGRHREAQRTDNRYANPVR